MISSKSLNGCMGLWNLLTPSCRSSIELCRGKAKVQTFVLHLEQALKAIKQQHLPVMTEEEGIKHLKDYLFHGLKPTFVILLITCTINLTHNTVSW